MNKKLIILLSVATLCTPLAASADDEPKGKPDRKAIRADRPERAADGEGRRGKKRGNRPDFSSMTPEERLVAIKKRMKASPRMAEMLTKRFDEDESGTLSDAELTKATEVMAKRGKNGARGKGKGKKRGGEGKGPRGKGGDK